MTVKGNGFVQWSVQRTNKTELLTEHMETKHIPRLLQHYCVAASITQGSSSISINKRGQTRWKLVGSSQRAMTLHTCEFTHIKSNFIAIIHELCLFLSNEVSFSKGTLFCLPPSSLSWWNKKYRTASTVQDYQYF